MTVIVFELFAPESTVKPVMSLMFRTPFETESCIVIGVLSTSWSVREMPLSVVCISSVTSMLTGELISGASFVPSTLIVKAFVEV